MISNNIKSDIWQICSIYRCPLFLQSSAHYFDSASEGEKGKGIHEKCGKTIYQNQNLKLYCRVTAVLMLTELVESQ